MVDPTTGSYYSTKTTPEYKEQERENLSTVLDSPFWWCVKNTIENVMYDVTIQFKSIKWAFYNCQKWVGIKVAWRRQKLVSFFDLLGRNG